MDVALRSAEVEVHPGTAPVFIPALWMAAVGSRYFEAFDIPLIAGRDFHDGDRTADARTVLVNEAFVRRYMSGASPVGRRVRYAHPKTPLPWQEIVGVVRDVGMTPTDLGEAPYVFRAASPATAFPLVMGVRMGGDPEALVPRLRAIALDLDPTLRLHDTQSLDDAAWQQDMPQLIMAGAMTTVVALGLCLSAAGIFSLMSVSVARRTKEIGLRAALGATQGRLLAGIFTRALVLVGSGIALGNAVLLAGITLSREVDLAEMSGGLLAISAVMLTVGLLACVEPARRALRIQPTDALKEA
jgi:putative ABC transport system permease protein